MTQNMQFKCTNETAAGALIRFAFVAFSPTTAGQYLSIIAAPGTYTIGRVYTLTLT
jgi:hypothetical protein